MKRYTSRIFLSSLSLALAFVLSTSGCNSGASTAESSTNDGDSTQIVKVEPQDFPVNELPESYFGKQVSVTEEAGLKVTAANLMQSTGNLPDWLDQIISRESIVQFAQGILKDMPEELEFVQTASSIFDGPDGWKVFVVNFSTRPSSAAIIIYGAYLNEEKSYWAAQHSKGKLHMDLKHLEAGDGKVAMMGEWTHGEKAKPFKVTLTKESASMAQAK